jgi:hypothetical protein
MFALPPEVLPRTLTARVHSVNSSALANGYGAGIAIARRRTEDAGMWQVIGVLAGVAICSPQGGCGRTVNPAGSCSGVPVLSAVDAGQATLAAADFGGHYTIDFGQIDVGTYEFVELALADEAVCPFEVLEVNAPSDAEFTLEAFPLPAAIEGNCDPDAGAGPALTFSLRFEPWSRGAKTATLTLATDTAAAPRLTIDLTGSGI